MLPALAAGEDMGKASKDPKPLNHEQTVLSGQKQLLFCHGFSNTRLMGNHAGDTAGALQRL